MRHLNLNRGRCEMTEFFSMDWYKHLDLVLGRDPFSFLLEYMGTFAGAIAGVRLASIKKFDLFGAYVVGLVTALGGGTLRDIMLNLPPFWMKDASYLITTFAALVGVAVFGRRFISEKITWFVFDTIAISFFTVLGLEKTLMHGFPPWCAVIMGVVTGVFGGVLRDVLINDVPAIFRKEIYAIACLIGAVLYIILYEFFGVSSIVCCTSCVLLIFILRALAIHYSWAFPVLRGRPIHVHRKCARKKYPRLCEDT